MPDFLRSDAYGEIFLAGHRITFYHLITDYQAGYTSEELVVVYPTLSLAQAEKVIAFFLENKLEVERYLEVTRAEIERQASVPQQGPSMPELKGRLEAKRHSESA
ncbi:MAG: DUF433 domain-containing protein [Planctomycetes bacterium]|nr:DUF433 domain-containing protein [Planctomycetota bacterium]